MRGTTLKEPGSIAMSPTVATQPGKSRTTVSRTPSTNAAAPRAASRRPSIGVVPAWRASPSNTTLNELEPMIPVTMPISTPARSSTGPCSMCSSRQSHERRRIAACREHATLGQSDPLELGDEEITTPTWGLEHLRSELARKCPAPERSDQRSLFVGEVDRFEGHREIEVRILHSADDLERAEHTEGAVVSARLSYRIEVRSEQQGLRSGRATRQDRRVVRRRVDVRLESGRPRTAEKPRARLLVSFRERRSPDPAVGCCTEGRQCVEVSTKAIQNPRAAASRRCYRGDGVRRAAPGAGRSSQSRPGGDTLPSQPCRHAVVMRDNRYGNERTVLGRVAEPERHQDRVDGCSVAQVLPPAQALALEAVRLVESNRGLVPRKDVQLELLHSRVRSPLDGLVEQRPADASPPVGLRNHDPEVSDVSTRRMQSRESESRATGRPPSSTTNTAASGCRRTARR